MAYSKLAWDGMKIGHGLFHRAGQQLTSTGAVQAAEVKRPS
jgi:hypothetical protein